MKNVDERLSNLKNTADISTFSKFNVTRDLKDKAKKAAIQSIDTNSEQPIKSGAEKFHNYKNKLKMQLVPVMIIAVIIIFLINFWPVGHQNSVAVAFTLKPWDTAELYSAGITGGEINAPMGIEIDSYSELYYHWSSNGRYLVYGDDGDIFIYDEKVKTSRNLTNTPDKWELMPSFSPDGNYIAFTSRPLEKGEGTASKSGADHWVMKGPFGGSPAVINIDGSGYRILEEGSVINPVTWSPDEKSAAYSINGKIHIYNFTSKDITVIKPEDYELDAKYLIAPAWSPAGNEIAVYYSKDDNIPSFEEVRAQTAPSVVQGYAVLGLKNKTSKIIFEYEAPFLPVRTPAIWNSKGDRLALLMRPELGTNPVTGLYVADKNGDFIEKIDLAYQAAWEPGGQRLAYLEEDDRRTIHIIKFSEKNWTVKENWAFEKKVYENFLQGFAWQPEYK